MVGDHIRYLLILATCFMQIILSIRLCKSLENLVGKVIMGKKLFMQINWKSSPHISRSEFFYIESLYTYLYDRR